MGMREISQACALLDAAVNITFEESAVTTSVECPVNIVERQVLIAEEEVVDQISPVTAPDHAESCALRPLMYILCDDDRAPRAMGRALLRMPELAATPDSCVLGQLHAEVQSVPELVRDASSAKGEMNVVCMFDQNVQWPEGTVLGSELVQTLRSSGFSGLIIMRTANDSDAFAETLLKLGADAVFSKGMGGKLVAPALLELHSEIVQKPNRHANLISNSTGPTEPVSA